MGYTFTFSGWSMSRPPPGRGKDTSLERRETERLELDSTRRIEDPKKLGDGDRFCFSEVCWLVTGTGLDDVSIDLEFCSRKLQLTNSYTLNYKRV